MSVAAPRWSDSVWTLLSLLVAWSLRVGLAALLLGWAAEIKLAGQFGAPVSPSQPIVPAGLVGATILWAAVVSAAEIGLLNRRCGPWWQAIVQAIVTGAVVAAGTLVLSRVVPAWRQTSVIVLGTFGLLLPAGFAWLAAVSVRSAAPASWRPLLHPMWVPLASGLGLILLGIWVSAGAETGPRGPASLLANARQTMSARYLPAVTYSSLPIIVAWEKQPGIYAPPPSELTLTTRLPMASRLRVTTDLQPSLFLVEGTGVRFQIAWADENSSRILFDDVLTQENRNRFGDRQPVEIDLGDLAGQNGRIIFRTIPVGIPPGPIVEAAWLNPRILSRPSLPATEGLIRNGLLAVLMGGLLTAWLRVTPESR